MFKVAYLLIFTFGGDSGRLITPEAIPMLDMKQCQQSRQLLKEQIEQSTSGDVLLFCIEGAIQ